MPRTHTSPIGPRLFGLIVAIVVSVPFLDRLATGPLLIV